jgi:hypothetical protein
MKNDETHVKKNEDTMSHNENHVTRGENTMNKMKNMCEMNA